MQLTSLRSRPNDVATLLLIAALGVKPAAAARATAPDDRLYQVEIASWGAGSTARAPFRTLVDDSIKLGMNAIKLDLPWRTTEIRQGRFDFERIDAQIAYLVEKGLKASVALSLRELPEWLATSRQEGQRLIMEDERGQPFSIPLFAQRLYVPSFHVPALKSAVIAYHRAIAEHFRGKPELRGAILYYLTTWTPSFESEYPSKAYCDYADAAHAAFARFLESTYGSIGTLNFLWAPPEPYASFEAVPMPVPEPVFAAPDLSLPVQDWFAFRTSALAEWVSACRDAIRSGDPEAAYGIMLSTHFYERAEAGAAKRGTYAFPAYAKGLDWIVVDDAPDFDHAFSVDSMRATLPGTKIVNEIDGPYLSKYLRGSTAYRESALNELYFHQGRVAWEHGAHGVEAANWSVAFGGLPPADLIADWPFFKRLGPLARKPVTKLAVAGTRHVSVQELFAHHEDSDFIEGILRDYARDSRNGAAALDVIYHADQLVADEAEGRTSFRVSKDLDGRQGSGRWHYLEPNARRFRRLVWDGGANRFRGATGGNRIAKGVIEPDVADPLILWIAPARGTVEIEAPFRKEAAGGNGFRVTIGKLSGGASQTVLETEVAGADTSLHPFAARCEVNRGDTIALRVEVHGDARYDRLLIDPAIAYVTAAAK